MRVILAPLAGDEHDHTALAAAYGLDRRLAAYFPWQGVMTQTHASYPEDSIGAGLLAGAQELGANLLVRGGYAHSRVREMILGGVTRHVPRHLALTVLIAH